MARETDMEFMIGFRVSLLQAARLHLPVVLAAPVLVFLGVEGWRAIVWLFDSVAANAPMNGAPGHDPLIAVVYAVSAACYITMAVASRVGDRVVASLYALLSVLHVLGGTVSIYGLLAAMEGLIPSLSHYDLLSTTGVSMSILLGAYLLFHRRVDH